jgi:hypothetical protein
LFLKSWEGDGAARAGTASKILPGAETASKRCGFATLLSSSTIALKPNFCVHKLKLQGIVSRNFQEDFVSVAEPGV